MSDLFHMSLWLAGEAGQTGLARTAEEAGLRAAVDQHVAEIRDALGEPVTEGVLLSYARGFTDAAVARGWWPPHGRVQAADTGLGWPGWASEPDGQEAGLDWESLRLAAVCQLFLQVRGLAPQV